MLDFIYEFDSDGW